MREEREERQGKGLRKVAVSALVQGADLADETFGIEQARARVDLDQQGIGACNTRADHWSAW